jgi:hypothetical protein
MMNTLRRLAKSKSLALMLAVGVIGTTLSFAQQPPPWQRLPCPYSPTPLTPPGVCHPYPQPRLNASTLSTSSDGTTITVVTDQSLFLQPQIDAFTKPPGTNFLPTIYTNAFDGNGKEMVNTLPSTPTNPYNLHDGYPVVTEINPTSPTDDLRGIFEVVTRLSNKERKEAADEEAIRKAIQFGIDILEGNPVQNRAYSGLPLLHYTGPEKVKKVQPIKDDNGTVIGGNVDVHQVWYDNHIESDTSMLDPSQVQDVPWTITYTVDVLSRGEDDFSPFVMYFDDPALSPPGMPRPHVGMDQSFFPMEDGTRIVFKIKMTLGKYYNLVYTWGWRVHPPRVQVMENANKKVSINGGTPLTLVEWETSVFGTSPRSSEENKLKAIGMIGDLSPAKRMWRALRDAREAARLSDYRRVVTRIREAQDAFDDWRDRTRLPRGVEIDKDADLTLFYVNNTIYAQFTDLSHDLAASIRIDFPRWKLRGTALKVTLYNGDYFDHGYQNVDFGGARGWENQFKSSVKTGGSGCWFTFGRVHWWMNIPNTAATPNNSAGDMAVVVPPATQNPFKLGLRKVQITYNYEPSRRLRFYQFDPIHHDVAVLSIH